MVFLLVVAAALMVTVIGARELIGQVLAAHSLKSGVITSVVDLGLVIVGPVLLLAYIRLMPQAVMLGVFARLRGRTLGSQRTANPRRSSGRPPHRFSLDHPR